MAAFSKLRENLSATVFGRISPQAALAAAGTAAVVWKFFQLRAVAAGKRKRKTGDDITDVIEQQHELAKVITPPKRDKAAVDGVFFKRMITIIKILVPGWFTPEMGYLLIVALSLMARTYCDVWMIQNGTAIEAAIIGRNRALFMKHLLAYVYAMPLISVVNNTMKIGLNELKLRFRTRLTTYFYDKYLRGYTYYQMSNLDNRISNPDQLLTQDTEKFCDSVAELYSNLSKPLLDIFIYAVKLTSQIGAQGPGKMFAYLVFSGLVLTRLRQPVGRLTADEQKLEGEFRYVNSRLITNSEEVAFYNGNKKEQTILLSTFGRLVDHVRGFIQFRFYMGLVDNIVAKYVATLVGYTVVSKPFIDLSTPKYLNSTHGQRLEDYYQSGRMLVKMAEAIGRIVLAGREMTRLAGFTARITELMQVLDDLNKGRYQRTMVTDSSRDSQSKLANLKPGSGKVRHQDYIIRFDHVPLVTPNGDVLVEDMNFEVKSGVNVLVCGPNGCGKSSLFRVLGELWPLFGGTLTKPDKGKLFYVPQRPYMTLGTLRDQIIYPDTKDDMRRKRISDSHLVTYLDKVQLGYILEREGGWESVQDWMDVLSGGEKQRIAMARLFYHKPQFAILDECTSAVSVDVEGAMYQYCKETGISLFTVSHRKSLWTHHEYYLHMDGRGKYEYKPITDDTMEFGS